MLDDKKILDMKREWLTYSKNVPDRLTPQNRLELSKYLHRYAKNLDMGLRAFRYDLEVESYRTENKPIKHEIEYVIEKTATAWWGFFLAINEMAETLRKSSDTADSPEKIEQDKAELKSKYPNTDWDDYFERNPRKTQAELDRIKFEQILPTLKTDKARAERKWRDFWNVLKDLSYFLSRHNFTDVGVETSFSEERQTVQGVPVGFVGGLSFEDKKLIVNEHIPFYVGRVKEYFPRLLNYQLPFVFHGSETSDCGSTAAACYKGKRIEITASGFRFNRTNKEAMCHILAHEMGHHYFDILSGSAKDFWTSAIKGDFGDLDLEEVGKITDKINRESDLKEAYPILYLQDYALFHKRHKDYYSLESAVKAYRDGKIGRFIKVPMNPITGYAVKNPEEAFCEAFGMLVAYGANAVLGKIKYLLSVVLSGHLKISSRTKRASDKAYRSLWLSKIDSLPHSGDDPLLIQYRDQLEAGYRLRGEAERVIEERLAIRSKPSVLSQPLPVDELRTLWLIAKRKKDIESMERIKALGLDARDGKRPSLLDVVDFKRLQKLLNS